MFRTAAIVLSCVLCCWSRAGDDPVMGTFTTDPVLLLTENVEKPGLDEFTVRHGNFNYRFATAESRDAFRADPARYEIQLGGACGRMGALSGCADPERYAVHEGKIYIFASDGCRAGFLKNPTAVLEPLSDPAPAGTPEQMARGRELVDKCLEWMGGAARLDAISTIEVREESQVEHNGAQHRQLRSRTLRLPDTIRTDYRWDDSSWTKTLTPDGAFFIDSGTIRSMHPQQRTVFAREMAREIPVIFRARVRPDFIACDIGPARDGAGELVAVHFDSTTTELIINRATGALSGIRYVDWGPKGRLGTVERRFTDFEVVGGCRIPNGWQAWFDDERAESIDKTSVTHVVDPKLPAAFFTREGGPVEYSLAKPPQ